MAELRAVDVVTAAGCRSVGLPATYPFDGRRRIGWERTQPIGLRAFDAGEEAIAARSAALADGERGEELARIIRTEGPPPVDAPAPVRRVVRVTISCDRPRPRTGATPPRARGAPASIRRSGMAGSWQEGDEGVAMGDWSLTLRGADVGSRKVHKRPTGRTGGRGCFGAAAFACSWTRAARRDPDPATEKETDEEDTAIRGRCSPPFEARCTTSR